MDQPIRAELPGTSPPIDSPVPRRRAMLRSAAVAVVVATSVAFLTLVVN
jgi:hypothetical protein